MFAALKLTKNADIDKYKYFGYSSGFGCNVILFRVDMSSSVHADKK